MLHRFRRRLQYWLQRDHRSERLREEIQLHIEGLTQSFMEAGMTESEALSAARRQFGNTTQTLEEARSMWIARWFNDLLQDAMFATRIFRKQPGFAAVAILSAAIGTGACSLIFGVANFALFRPLPVESPERLVSISGKSQRQGKVGISLSHPDVEDLRQANALEDITAHFQFMPATIASNGEPQRYWGSIVTANYFDVVRPPLILGRGFDPSKDNRVGEAPVVVLSHHLWKSRFGRDANIIGRTIDINRRKVTVVGVTGAGFRGTEPMFFSDFWLPFSMLTLLAESGMGGDRLHNRGSSWLTVTGRLRHGVTVESAAAQVEIIGKRLSAAYPSTNEHRGFHIERAGQVNPGFRKVILVLFLVLIAVAILLHLTACANVANLLLARASARQQEIATRLAIGAGRGRIVRQLLTESVVLALLGGLAGYVFAQLGVSALGNARIPGSMPVDFTVSLDYRVMLFCALLSAMTGIVFGLIPALQATRQSLTGALKDDRLPIGLSRRFGLRDILVVAQIAICMVLLICSNLFLRSLQSASTIEPGFAHRNLLMMAFDPSLNHYSSADTRRVVEAILDGAAAIPGAESATLTSSVPLSMEGTQNSFLVEQGGEGKDRTPIRADIYSIAPRFFETLGIHLIDGEDFRPGPIAEDVVIANQALADRAFPRQNIIGRRILYLGRTVRIIGLVATTKSRTIGEDPHPCLYFPIAGDLRGNDSLTGITLIVRTKGDPTLYAPILREAFRTVDPTLAVFDVRTMDEQLSRALFLPRLTASLFGLAGFVGLLISTVGIYGVVSFAVSRQTREIGVRMALGAHRGQVLGMVLKHGLTLTAIGSIAGLGLALALSRLVASLLYGVNPTDPWAFFASPLILLAVTMTACAVPARRAASLDPIRALKYD